jgi:hypothetical protein
MKRRTDPRERFLKLDHGMLMTAAWQHLQPRSMKLLIEVWRRYDGKNNGRIPFSMREAMECLQCGRDQAIRAFRELTDKGFLRVARDSGFNTKKQAREWTITALPIGDKPATRDFERWEPSGC